jgi:hypothetical protein
MKGNGLMMCGAMRSRFRRLKINSSYQGNQCDYSRACFQKRVTPLCHR